MKSELRINWLIAIGLAGWLMYLLAPILALIPALIIWAVIPVAKGVPAVAEQTVYHDAERPSELILQLLES